MKTIITILEVWSVVGIPIFLFGIKHLMTKHWPETPSWQEIAELVLIGGPIIWIVYLCLVFSV